jgi:ketosteroid isomerase-like protein
MHHNAALVQRLYRCLRARDPIGMRRCYHPDLVFHDPVFGELDWSEAAAMWSLLCARGEDLEIRWSDVSADDVEGSARWEAWYTMVPTGRTVHNRIEARFRFRDGLIVRHEDRFSLWRWSRQALGPEGWLLGWSPWVRRRIRAIARRGLEAHVRRDAG